jgi:hypothetical protein
LEQEIASSDQGDAVELWLRTDRDARSHKLDLAPGRANRQAAQFMTNKKARQKTAGPFC